MEHIIQELQVQEQKLKEELDQIMTSAKHINQQLSQVQGALNSLSGGGVSGKSGSSKLAAIAKKPGIAKEALEALMRQTLVKKPELTQEKLYQAVQAQLDQQRIAKHGLKAKFQSILNQACFQINEAGCVSIADK